MIAADTSSVINFLNGEDSSDAALVEEAIRNCALVLPPMVVSELLSSPRMTTLVREMILQLPCPEIKEGFWERVGDHRATLLKSKLKARLADSMIATFCLDHNLPMIAKDSDYRHFAKHFGLLVQAG